MVNVQRTHPVAGGGVQAACHGRVGLEEALRADPQRHAVEALRQRVLVGEENLFLPFHDRHMHRLNVRRNDLQLRKLRLQPRQGRAQLLKLSFRAQHEAQHHAAVDLAFGQQKVLQLAALAGHVIGR